MDRLETLQLYLFLHHKERKQTKH